MNAIELTGLALVLAMTTATRLALAQEPEPVAPDAPTESAVPTAVAAPAPAPAAPAVAEPAPAAAAELTDAPATGLMLQARMQSQGNLLSLGGGPGFLLGYRGGKVALGLGVGLSRLSGSSEGDSISGTLFQLVPTALIDVWRSRDGRARANVLGGVGFGRGALKAEYAYEDCVYDPVTGSDNCTTTMEESKANATFIPVMLGLGGDYFLGRNFALGAEGGFQASFLASTKTEESGQQSDVDVSGGMQFAYSVIRATMVFGN